jgi:hypothetical protein
METGVFWDAGPDQVVRTRAADQLTGREAPPQRGVEGPAVLRPVEARDSRSLGGAEPRSETTQLLRPGEVVFGVTQSARGCNGAAQARGSFRCRLLRGSCRSFASASGLENAQARCLLS